MWADKFTHKKNNNKKNCYALHTVCSDMRPFFISIPTSQKREMMFSYKITNFLAYRQLCLGW